jgi:UDP-N-acetylglucosamine 2-epimerase (non-hydrolysing)
LKPLAVVAGTRPEIIKNAPFIRALTAAKLPFSFVLCGQHYDYNMVQQFIEELDLPAPDYQLKIEASTPAVQTAEILVKMTKLLGEMEPSMVSVEGDTNSVLASAVAANKQGIPLAHVEAGLRSYDLRMPEEHNRRIVDHISNYLFAPTERAKSNLTKEQVYGHISLTGNTVIDAVNQHMPMAEKKSTIMQQVPFANFALATAHRAENVDDLAVLHSIIEVLEKSPIPIVYPMHPRTRKRLQEKNLLNKLQTIKNLLILQPLGYLDFLVLMKNCQFILTDSGGIQEEATAPAIHKRVLVMRLSTERQEAVEAGFATVVGTDSKNILNAMKSPADEKLPEASPFGNGFAAQEIVKKIKEIV